MCQGGKPLNIRKPVFRLAGACRGVGLRRLRVDPRIRRATPQLGDAVLVRLPFDVVEEFAGSGHAKSRVRPKFVPGLYRIRQVAPRRVEVLGDLHQDGVKRVIAALVAVKIWRNFHLAATQHVRRFHIAVKFLVVNDSVKDQHLGTRWAGDVVDQRHVIRRIASVPIGPVDQVGKASLRHDVNEAPRVTRHVVQDGEIGADPQFPPHVIGGVLHEPLQGLRVHEVRLRLGVETAQSNAALLHPIHDFAGALFAAVPPVIIKRIAAFDVPTELGVIRVAVRLPAQPRRVVDKLHELGPHLGRKVRETLVGV